ncbi:conserved hypothetical protein [Trichinella spiralis]|uniref:hypothetical protein n=1 Tax=Trichinella spiralis TaxID=6334 RepID=UPI0001EFD59B|nr:conserved hypothetical protein [Trichinella spiralis]
MAAKYRSLLFNARQQQHQYYIKENSMNNEQQQMTNNDNNDNKILHKPITWKAALNRIWRVKSLQGTPAAGVFIPYLLPICLIEPAARFLERSWLMAFPSRLPVQSKLITTRYFVEPTMPAFQVVIGPNIYIMYIPKRQAIIGHPLLPKVIK